jgi:transcriptional pleiotropic regulator of transition state genes
VKSTGMTRRIDDLGRIVLPVEIRRAFLLKPGDELQIHVDGDRIVLAKAGDRCVFCEGADDLTEFRDRRICAGCVAELAPGR